MLLSSINIKKRYQVAAVTILILVVSVFHYFTPQDESLLHVVYREFYFLPIILSGFWFGLRGGLTAALVITALYLPMLIGNQSGLPGYDLGNLLEILLFNIIGILVGWLQDREAFLQEARRKEQELAAMGKAIACIAHDMKTPLVAIGGFVRQVRRNLPEEDITSRKLDIVLQQANRLELLVGDMLAFAKPLKLFLERGNLNECIREIILVVEEKFREHKVKLSFQPEENLLTCSYDSHRLQQALLNLINNGMEASAPGDEVVIRSRLENGKVVVEVEDNGRGIPTEQIDQVLQPFVSSKKEGTGLGLPIVKKIAEAHGGFLYYEQHDTNGMIFRLILPIADP